MRYVTLPNREEIHVDFENRTWISSKCEKAFTRYVLDTKTSLERERHTSVRSEKPKQHFGIFSPHFLNRLSPFCSAVTPENKILSRITKICFNIGIDLVDFQF